MRNLSHFYGFPVKDACRFTLGGRRYRVGANGTRSLELLSMIYDRCCSSADRSWSIGARPLIRKVQAWNERAVLNLVVERTRDPILRVLAIWLRGRCRGSIGTATLVKFADHPDFHTRKETARALQRMSAWRTLAVMAEADPSERIRRLATSTPARPFTKRIADFKRHLARIPVPAKRKTLYVAPQLDIGHGTPPKSPALIRAILERIRRLVTGNA